MNYAVVRFSSNVASEVPTIWTTNSDDCQSCWWPRGHKNIKSLIDDCVEPDFQKWKEYPVEIERTGGKNIFYVQIFLDKPLYCCDNFFAFCYFSDTGQSSQARS